MTMQLRAEELFGPQTPSALYERLREREPVCWCPELGAWLIARHADVREVLMDAEHFSAGAALGSDALDFRPLAGLPNLTFSRAELTTVNNADPPRHAALRRVLSSRAGQWRSPAEATLANFDTIIDDALARGRVDFIEEIVRPAAMSVLLALLGISEAHASTLTHGAAAFHDATRWREGATLVGSLTTNAHLGPTLARILADRTRGPREDLVSDLLRASAEDDGPSHAEVMATLVLLLVAGQETVTSAVGAALLRLASDADSWRRAAEDPDSLPGFIQETLRLDSPIQAVPRFCRKSRFLSGQTIERGQAVLALLASANRDPRAFTDPERFDAERDGQRHFAFGVGVHACPGHALGRVEARALLQRILARFPDGPPRIERYERDATLMFRGLRRLWLEVGDFRPRSARSYFAAVRAQVPQALVPDSAYRRVLAAAAAVPGGCAQTSFGFECPLAGPTRVDIGFQLETFDDGWLRDLERWPDPSGQARQAWTTWRSLAARRSTEAIDVAWAEFDASGHRPHTPSLFWRLREELSERARADAIEATLGDAAPRAALARVRDLPSGWRLTKFGAMLSRDRTPLRLCLGASNAALRAGIMELAPREIERDWLRSMIDELTARFSKIEVIVDIDEELQPWLALECGFLRHENLDEKGGPDPRWGEAMRPMVDAGLVDAPRVDAMIGYCGRTGVFEMDERWPEEVRARWARNLFTIVPVMHRRISHIKVTLGPSSVQRVKAYLTVNLTWHPLALR